MEVPQRKSAKLNYIYNVIAQVLLIVFPLITAPYISRVLDASSIGKNTFSLTAASYFVMLANFGFGYYAQRAIAGKQKDRTAQSTLFWEILIAKGSLSIFSSLVMVLLLCLNVFGDYTQVVWLYLANVITIAFDVSYLFQGNEEFLIPSLVVVVIRAVAVACIFIFVKTNADLLRYVLISVASTFLSSAALWLFVRRYVGFVSIKTLHPSKHYLPSLRLFIPNIAVSIYALLDKTLIGVLVPGTTERVIDGVQTSVSNADVENGYYYQAEQIIKMCETVIGSLANVMIPRNSYEFEKGNLDGVKENIYKAVRFVWLLGIPMCFGLIAVAYQFVPVFFGAGYEKSAPLMMILCPIILAIGMSGTFGAQYLIPTKRDKAFTISVCLGALINFTLNCCLIPSLWGYGAAIGTVVAETFIAVFQWLIIRKEISGKRILTSSWKYWVSGGVMFGVVYALALTIFKEPHVWSLIVEVVVGILVYGVALLLLKDQLVYEELGSLKRKFSKKPDE
jgi:O-antigen/teichoic acid export membrane protein